ncbi:sushi domain-containing protein 5 [Ambystoma mexicanum]|uniref:sushi domain-containing protein 5 n=1 Tax=Ambystoma mexicanum TaxID=8296 RepID=UPI0037E8BBEA
MAQQEWHKGSLAASFLLRVGPVLLLHLSLVRGHGKLFIVESKNGSQELDLLGARRECGAVGSRLATADELRLAVRECSLDACVRGWLSDSTVGTILCHKLQSARQIRKIIDVSIESATSPTDRFDAFCVKDEDKLCGDPPSFPHTILYGHSEFEMGDELMYVCAPGYIMGNKMIAFSLVCNICGEWYGHVHACVKGDTQLHIDYEDNFPDDRTMSVTEPDEDEVEDEDGEEAAYPFSRETETKTGQEEAQGIFDAIETESKAPTESPVSLLSQEHLFWFNPEVFNEPEGERELEVGTKTQFSNGNNHIGLKTDFSESGTKMVYDNEDFPIGPSVVTNDTKTEKGAVDSTDESWLDGYPVTQDAVEEGEKIDGSMGLDEETILATDQPNYVEVKTTGITKLIPERDISQIPVAPTKSLDSSIKGVQAPLTPASSRENVSTSKGVEDTVRLRATTQVDFPDEESVTPTEFHEHLNAQPTAILETYATVRPVDHIPAPTEEGETTTYLSQADTNTSPAQATTAFIDITLSEEDSEGGTLANELGGEQLPTSEPCTNDDCPDSSQGPMIAVVVTVLCLLLLATVLAVWCYKKRQQKSSVYKLNGKGQTRHPQHIEMQKV